MYRGTGTGLIGLGVVLVVVGAILDYAVTATTSGLSINTGWGDPAHRRNLLRCYWGDRFRSGVVQADDGS